jgi:hypothetical protein
MVMKNINYYYYYRYRYLFEVLSNIMQKFLFSNACVCSDGLERRFVEVMLRQGGSLNRYCQMLMLQAGWWSTLLKQA